MPSSQAAVEPVRGAAISRVGASTLLDIDKIRELVDMMVANDLVEISLRDGETEVSLRRPGPVGAAAPAVAAMPSAVLPMPAVAGSAPAGGSATVEDKAAAEDDIELTAIKSPMVGTFYASAEPSGPPFVDMGSPITADTVVCIVEAMKVFNEIKADVSGTIERVLVKNEDPVEYGQPLFLVRPPG